MTPPDYGVTTCRITLFMFQGSPSQAQDGISFDDIPWVAIVMLDVPSVDLEGLMQKGLFWTTQSIVGPAEGQKSSWRDLAPGHAAERFPWNIDDVRCWRLREFPHRPSDESRWTGRILLLTILPHTMSDFRLGQLARHHIRTADVMSVLGTHIFYFNPPNDKMDGWNSIILDKPPADLWWLWPMEYIVPEEMSAPVLPSQDYIRSGHVGKEYPVNHGCESWKEVVLLLLDRGDQARAWGLTLLLCAASALLMALSVVIATSALT